MVEGGIEHYNSAVDEVLETGMLKRVLAQTDINFSNSMIESWWAIAEASEVISKYSRLRIDTSKVSWFLYRPTQHANSPLSVRGTDTCRGPLRQGNRYS